MPTESNDRQPSRRDGPALVILEPIFADLDAAKAEAECHTPGGVLLEHDLDGLRKRVARRHGVTPEDLKRWEGLYRD